ncbi:hypothetical protein [Microvirgula aerodenitrificans]|uniref:hypothetical protein n=1 Tax=Microvirgula aerodenitrificans TaxID=57480 RepID=UPI00248ED589|nr:hypothetical protein [Microvirgula aerodenitrificans]
MKFDSAFFFTGAAICGTLFLADAAWVLLPIPLLLMFTAVAIDDCRRLRSLDADAAAMLLDTPRKPMMPLDGFRGRELMFYSAGQPVYRFLSDGQQLWIFLGHRDEVDAPDVSICVFPGYLYGQAAHSGT